MAVQKPDPLSVDGPQTRSSFLFIFSGPMTHTHMFFKHSGASAPFHINQVVVEATDTRHRKHENGRPRVLGTTWGLQSRYRHSRPATNVFDLLNSTQAQHPTPLVTRPGKVSSLGCLCLCWTLETPGSIDDLRVLLPVTFEGSPTS